MKTCGTKTWTAVSVAKLIIGSVLVAAAALNLVPLPLGYIVALAGFIAIISGLTGTCPACALLGLAQPGEKKE